MCRLRRTYKVVQLREGSVMDRPKKQQKQPSEKTMERWLMDGKCKATDGCWVEPDGTCPHGCKSWAIMMGIC